MHKNKLKAFFIGFILILILGKIAWISFHNTEAAETYEEIPRKNACVALSYHYIGNDDIFTDIFKNITNTEQLTKYTVNKNEFEKQINKLIEEKAYFATLDEVESFRKSGEFPDKCVWISFDDGDESVYKNAFPFLKEKHIPFTMFIIAGQVGNNDFSNLKLVSWDELRDMRDSKLVSFGSHTYDMHYLQDNKAKFLSEDQYDEFKTDIKKSKDTIKENLDVDVTSISYPFGSTSNDVTEIVKEEGFTDAFILAAHPITSINDAYYQNRYMITSSNFYEIVVPWLKKN